MWNTQTYKFTISGKERQVPKKFLTGDSELVFYLVLNNLESR